jgi:hypothetical protein
LSLKITPFPIPDLNFYTIAHKKNRMGSPSAAGYGLKLIITGKMHPYPAVEGDPVLPVFSGSYCDILII